MRRRGFACGACPFCGGDGAEGFIGIGDCVLIEELLARTHTGPPILHPPVLPKKSLGLFMYFFLMIMRI
jgi:hypothetical protein